MAEFDPSAPAPRLCHLVRWPDFDGYGFNLHTDKVEQAQKIGKVDEGSPAEAAGLRQGDRIIEVNGINIANENHKQVVERIKAVPDQTRLLVADAETYKWYAERKIVIRGTQNNVIYLRNPSNRNGGALEQEREPVAVAEGDRAEPPAEHHQQTSVDSRKGSIKSSEQVAVIHERKSSVSSAKSNRSEVEVHPPPRDIVIHPETEALFVEPLAHQQDDSSTKNHRSLSEARRDFFRYDPEEHQIDLTTLGYPQDYTQLKTSPPAVDHEPETKPEGHVMEILNEQVVISTPVPEDDDAASKLLGYRPMDEKEQQEEELRARSSSATIVNGGDHSTAALVNGHREELSESVTHSPAFENGEVKERAYEKTEVRRRSGASHHSQDRRVQEAEVKAKDSGNEDAHSNHNSVGSSDSSSDKGLGSTQGTYDVTLSDDARTPSPSPAVVLQSRFPPFPVTNGNHQAEARAVPTSRPTAATSDQFASIGLPTSAKEMRAKLASRAREDPRKKPIDLLKKYEMVNNL